MNGNYYQNPTFPINEQPGVYQGYTNTIPDIQPKNYNEVSQEQSYIENILRMNKGKPAKIYVSYPESSAWQNKIYTGTVEAAGKDHLIVKDSESSSWFLIRLIYLDYVEFMEPINYSPLFVNNTVS